MSRAQNNPYLGDRTLDDLARMMMQMLAELSIQRDRMSVIEELLRRRSVLAAGEVDDFVPEGAFDARLEAERNELVEVVLGAPERPLESVETLVSRGRAVRARRAEATASAPVPKDVPGA